MIFSIYLFCFFQKHELFLCLLGVLNTPVYIVCICARVNGPGENIPLRFTLYTRLSHFNPQRLVYPCTIRHWQEFVSKKTQRDDKEYMGVYLISRYYLIKMLLVNNSIQSLRMKSKHFFDAQWSFRPGITNGFIYMPTPVSWEWLPGALGWERLDAMAGPSTE